MPRQPTVLKNGVSTNEQGLANWYPYPDPDLFHIIWDDFSKFNPADWDIQATGAATQNIVNARGGLLEMVNTGTLGDEHIIQTQARVFDIEDDKRYYMSFSLTSPDYENQTIICGLSEPGFGVNTSNERFYFGFRPTSSDVNFYAFTGGAGYVSPVLANPANGEMIKLAAFLDERKVLSLYVNDRQVEKVDLAALGSPVLPMAPISGVLYQRSTGSIERVQFDNMLIAEER